MPSYYHTPAQEVIIIDKASTFEIQYFENESELKQRLMLKVTS
jgi:hypothetical protein